MSWLRNKRIVAPLTHPHQIVHIMSTNLVVVFSIYIYPRNISKLWPVRVPYFYAIYQRILNSYRSVAFISEDMHHFSFAIKKGLSLSTAIPRPLVYCRIFYYLITIGNVLRFPSWGHHIFAEKRIYDTYFDTFHFSAFTLRIYNI